MNNQGITNRSISITFSAGCSQQDFEIGANSNVCATGKCFFSAKNAEECTLLRFACATAKALATRGRRASAIRKRIQPPSADFAWVHFASFAFKSTFGRRTRLDRAPGRSTKHDFLPYNILPVIRRPLNAPSGLVRKKPLPFSENISVRDDRMFKITGILHVSDVPLDL